MKEKNMFKRGNWKSDRVLVCKNCEEMLFICDIEHYEKCPYCDARIDIDIEIEDYILKPVVDKWIRLQRKPNVPLDDLYA